MIAVTPKGLEHGRVSAAAFAAFVSESLRELGKPAADSSYMKFLDSQPPGQAALLTELRKDPEIVSVLQGARLPSPPRGMFGEEKPAQYVLSSTTLILLRGKALNLSVYSAYEGPLDVDWIRSTTTRWIEQIQRLNPR